MNQTSGTIRRPAVAGMFYPGTAVELIKTIAGMFAEAEKTPLANRPQALIAPHAGYTYSGKVAARAYKLIEGEEYDTVVVVSPSHTVFFKGSSVYEGDGYETPIGVVEVDKKLARKLGSINPSAVYLSSMGHATGTTRGEHALEVQLPFLQVVLGSKFKLVPIVMGDQEEESILSLGEALASAFKGTNTLMIASTDLSHFYHEKQARKLDTAMREAIESFDPQRVIDTMQSGKGEACGAGPVAAVMLASKRLGAEGITFLEYKTSGDVTGDFTEVVGYLSAAIVSGKAAEAERTASIDTRGTRVVKREDSLITEEDQAHLRKVVHDAIENRLKNRKYEPPYRESLDIRRGVFVTLKVDGQLRGCIGMVKAREPLYDAVASMATAAAFEDPRFPEVTADEFGRLTFSISVLSPLERVRDFGEIEVGRDGLMVKLDMHSGLLLPQVASENGWDPITFLEQTSLKAGLPKGSYKDRFAEIYRFSAQLF